MIFTSILVLLILAGMFSAAMMFHSMWKELLEAIRGRREPSS